MLTAWNVKKEVIYNINMTTSRLFRDCWRLGEDSKHTHASVSRLDQQRTTLSTSGVCAQDFQIVVQSVNRTSMKISVSDSFILFQIISLFILFTKFPNDLIARHLRVWVYGASRWDASVNFTFISLTRSMRRGCRVRFRGFYGTSKRSQRIQTSKALLLLKQAKQ